MVSEALLMPIENIITIKRTNKPIIKKIGELNTIAEAMDTVSINAKVIITKEASMVVSTVFFRAVMFSEKRVVFKGVLAVPVANSVIICDMIGIVRYMPNRIITTKAKSKILPLFIDIYIYFKIYNGIYAERKRFEISHYILIFTVIYPDRSCPTIRLCV